MVVCLKDFLWIVKGTGKYQLVHLIIADPKRHNKTSVWVFPLINLPSALIYNMLQLSHGEEEKLTPIFNKSLFLNLFQLSPLPPAHLCARRAVDHRAHCRVPLCSDTKTNEAF